MEREGMRSVDGLRLLDIEEVYVKRNRRIVDKIEKELDRNSNVFLVNGYLEAVAVAKKLLLSVYTDFAYLFIQKKDFKIRLSKIIRAIEYLRKVKQANCLVVMPYCEDSLEVMERIILKRDDVKFIWYDCDVDIELGSKFFGFRNFSYKDIKFIIFKLLGFKDDIDFFTDYVYAETQGVFNRVYNLVLTLRKSKRGSDMVIEQKKEFSQLWNKLVTADVRLVDFLEDFKKLLSKLDYKVLKRCFIEQLKSMVFSEAGNINVEEILVCTEYAVKFKEVSSEEELIHVVISFFVKLRED